MYKILDNLYQGPAPKEKVDNIQVVINLVIENPVIDLSLYSNLVMYSYLPIEDGPCPGLPWLQSAVSVAQAFRKNHNILIHCRGGVSRSVMLTAAILMETNEFYMNVDNSLNFIASKNPSIDPAPRFINLLKEYRSHWSR